MVRTGIDVNCKRAEGDPYQVPVSCRMRWGGVQLGWGGVQSQAAVTILIREGECLKGRATAWVAPKTARPHRRAHPDWLPRPATPRRPPGSSEATPSDLDRPRQRVAYFHLFSKHPLRWRQPPPCHGQQRFVAVNMDPAAPEATALATAADVREPQPNDSEPDAEPVLLFAREESGLYRVWP